MYTAVWLRSTDPPDWQSGPPQRGIRSVTDTRDPRKIRVRRPSSADEALAIMSTGKFFAPTHHPPVALEGARVRAAWTGVQPRVGG